MSEVIEGVDERLQKPISLVREGRLTSQDIDDSLIIFRRAAINVIEEIVDYSGTRSRIEESTPLFPHYDECLAVIRGSQDSKKIAKVGLIESLVKNFPEGELTEKQIDQLKASAVSLNGQV